ncbi:chromate transporter, partial [Planococcus sp. SIMBA_160]
QGFGVSDGGGIKGLKIVAVAVVAHAVLGMAKNLAPDLKRKGLALLALIGTLFWPSSLWRIGVILLAALFGYLLYQNSAETT